VFWWRIVVVFVLSWRCIFDRSKSVVGVFDNDKSGDLMEAGDREEVLRNRSRRRRESYMTDVGAQCRYE
jgi:hypothetical protein